MKTIISILTLLVFIVSGNAQITEDDYNKKPQGLICDQLMVADFTCENCSMADVERFNLPKSLKGEVTYMLGRYVHCYLASDRMRIAEIVGLGDDETSLSEFNQFSSGQRETIRQFTKAERALFGTLSIEYMSQDLLLRLDVVNLKNAISEGSAQISIPNGDYHQMSKRIGKVEEVVAELVIGRQNLSHGSSGNGGNGFTPSTAPTRITDPHGNVYETVEIAGKIWMTSNLNYEVPGSWCFNDKITFCMNYGRLYTWDAARSACPQLGPGWRLPSDQEWKELAASMHGYFMIQPDFTFKMIGDNPTLTFMQMQKGGGSGFDAQLAGRRDEANNFNEFENVGFYWSNTPFDQNLTWAWMLMRMNPLDGVLANSTGPLPWLRTNGHSCRCVKDKF